MKNDLFNFIIWNNSHCTLLPNNTFFPFFIQIAIRFGRPPLLLRYRAFVFLAIIAHIVLKLRRPFIGSNGMRPVAVSYSVAPIDHRSSL